MIKLNINVSAEWLNGIFLDVHSKHVLFVEFLMKQIDKVSATGKNVNVMKI